MPRSQRPKQEKETPEIATLHSFFGSVTQSTHPIRTPSKPAEVIIIDSDDENPETSPTRPKRKARGDSDIGSSSCSKKGKHPRDATQPVLENGPPLKPVPSSSLNRTIGMVDADLYTQTNQTQLTLTGDWEMGDDEFLDLIDDSQVFGGESDGSENTLDTCPVCGAIFVDFCLSVSATLHH